MDGTTWMIIIGCITLETMEQSLYRVGSESRRRWFQAIPPAVILHIASLGLWMLLLRRIPLGVALPMMGANFVTIAIVGRLAFGEQITRRRLAGVMLVVVGFVMVAMDATERL